MPFIRTAEGQVVEVGADAIFNDPEGTNPLQIPTGPVFTSEDIERARQQEKDKLYGRIDNLTSEITNLTQQVGGLTADQQREKARLEEERAAAQEEARRQEEQGLDPNTLIERTRNEFQSTLREKETEWNQRFEAERQERERLQAERDKERQFNSLREYALAQVEANKDNIAPQFLRFIEGNTEAEIDAKIAQAVESTNEIAAEMQQAFQQQQDPQVQQQQQQQQTQQPPVGTRATGLPGSFDPTQQRQLTAEDIANMPMGEYAKYRQQVGIGGQSQERGLFG